jgi:Fe-S cluster assembly protein SufD
VDIYGKGAPDWMIELQCADPVDDERFGDMALWHLCNAHLRDGIAVDVPAGRIVDKPVEVTLSGHDGAFFVPRTAFRLGEGSTLTVIEYHRGEGRYWNNRLTQAIVGPGARVRHYRIQENSDKAVYTQNTHIRVERGGSYEGFTLSAGALLSRNQIHVDLEGEGAEGRVFGVNLVRGDRHSDTTATISHKAPRCTSEQFMRTILKDRAHGVFQGRVHVHPDAQKTDARQLSNALILSEGAEMDTKPELEIYADDVKCSHGATSGRLDDDALFYMRSRGVPDDVARSLLLSAFVGDVVDRLGDKTIQAIVRGKIEAWLAT